MFKLVIERFENIFESFILLLPHLISSVIFFGIILTLILGISWILERKILSMLNDKLLAIFLSQFIKWGLIIVGIIVALSIAGFGDVANKFLAGAGISAIIIGFAFKDLGENFLAGIMLAFSRPFSIKDSIECVGQKGLVMRVTLRNTHIRTDDGKDIYIPNAVIIKNPLINYTKDGLLRKDFTLTIIDPSNVEEAINIVLHCSKNQKEVLESPSPSVIIDEINEGKIKLKVLFWIDTFKTNKDQTIIKSHIIQSSRASLIQKGYKLSES